MPRHPVHAGASTRKMARRRRLIAFLLAGGLLLVAVALWFALHNVLLLAILVGAGALVGIILLSAMPDFFEPLLSRSLGAYRRAVRGAAAEEQMGALLATLDETYCVFHDVPSPYGNIDHVVLGQHGGVFLLETKSHPGRVHVVSGTILVNRRRAEKDFIAQTLRNTYWLRDVLSQVVGVRVWITPLIVFTRAVVVPSPPTKGVLVINRKYLLQALTKRANATPGHAQPWVFREQIREALYSGKARGAGQPRMRRGIGATPTGPA